MVPVKKRLFPHWCMAWYFEVRHNYIEMEEADNSTLHRT